jgi:hypothetical protein
MHELVSLFLLLFRANFCLEIHVQLQLLITAQMWTLMRPMVHLAAVVAV